MYKLITFLILSVKSVEIDVSCNYQGTEISEEEQAKCLQDYLCKMNANPDDPKCVKEQTGLITLPNGMQIAPRGAAPVTDDYGCWCRSRTTFENAKGNPVDELDRTCRFYVQGLSCVQMDYPTCSIATIDWTSKVQVSFVNNNLHLSCDNTSQDCEYAICEVELYALEQQSIAKNTFGQFPQNMHPTFNPDVQCISADNGLGPVEKDQCCGAYPARYPYSSQGNFDQAGGVPARECCATAGKTYNPLLASCCNDGTIKASCN